MGKSKQKVSKKSKGVGVDFKRVKRKVGKKLPRADNATRTDFKSKGLLLPEQSIAAEKGAAVSSRNLTLKDLLSQTGHYSAKTRRDALSGLQELLQRHPAELQLHTSTIVETLAPRFADSERAVRDVLRKLLRTSLFPNLPQERLLPFFPVLTAHICSAMTHMAPDVRAAALSYVDLLVEFYPGLIQQSPGAATEVLGHYIDLLAGSEDRGRTPAQLLEVLSSLRRFLGTVCRTADSAASMPVSRSERVWASRRSAPVQPLYSFCSQPVDPGGEEAVKGPAPFLMSSDRLIPILLSCWLECTPSTLSESPNTDTSQALLEIVNLLDLVLHQGTKSRATAQVIEWQPEGVEISHEQHLPPLLQKVMPYFPIAAPPSGTSSKVVEDLVSLNIKICQLMLQFLPPLEEPAWAASLLDYLEGLLQGQLLPASGLSEGLVCKQLPGSHCRAVLAGLKSSLPLVDIPRRTRLLEAFTSFFATCPPTSEAKRAGLDLMLALLQDSGRLSTDLSSLLTSWLKFLPKLLWELKIGQPATTHKVLLLLHRASLTLALTDLQPLLLPFFCTSVPAKRKQTESRVVFGPFVRLPVRTQALALDLLPSLEPLSPGLLKALVSCCLAPDIAIQTAVRVVEVLLYCTTIVGSLDTGDFLNAVLTLLLKREVASSSQAHIDKAKGSEAARMHKPWTPADPLTKAIAASLMHLGDRQLMLELLGPLLEEHLLTAVSEQKDEWVRALLHVTLTCCCRKQAKEQATLLMPSSLEGALQSALVLFGKEMPQNLTESEEPV